MRAVVLSRDLSIVIVAVTGLTALAWFDVWQRTATMNVGAGMAMAMPRTMPWNAPDLTAAALMWSVMMIAMMLPSATPIVLFFSGIQRTRKREGHTAVPAGLFVAGFLLIWLAWSQLAAGLQWVLQSLFVLSPQLAPTRLSLAVAFLLLAGLYQFTPWKNACLARCQTPLSFILTQWREGPWGALHMGARYGAYCVGCCWALMGLLFVVGVMNLLWVALLAIFVLIEKTTVRGPWLARATGAVLIVWAAYLFRSIPRGSERAIAQIALDRATRAASRRGIRAGEVDASLIRLPRDVGPSPGRSPDRLW